MTALVWIGSIGLISAGIWLIIQGIQQIQKAVGGPVLLKLPLAQKTGQFILSQAGRYTIWQSGRNLQRVPVKMPQPVVSVLATGEKMMVHPSLSRVWVNNGWEGRIQVYTFWAPEGHYQLELTSPDMQLECQAPYFLEIREQKPGYILVMGILLVIIAAFCLISGLIFPFVLEI